ncbi:trypsin-like serine protease with C-terminal PDZ domain [Candidatus Nitrososphaera evergladensis SR1]|uniref:Trypsin-like serine protease with C-terminal PDZ domain n=1 Tax=Candidatus Nitrososphaera evergladensis SR1 TaxID=1459636 RepID=A0A075MTT2_9ARCH|nr:trypsin-like peptidase domain-containing protein [Candidatus Nitrososphaera evergladensis]AIF84553.1 trypsin-like serine protease with C-terminal PDZ domain [Candidatus Nitrososphaera evergladensis SR1]
MHRGLLAAAVVAAAVAIFFAYSQFSSLDWTPRTQLPDISKLITDNTDNTSDNPRQGLQNSAFEVGRVSTVEAADSEMTLPDLFDKAGPSVVQVSAGNDASEQGKLGSGFVYDDNGHIVTNLHVASGSNQLDVTFEDGTIYRATLLGSDPFTDLAVLYIKDAPKDKLVPLPLADSTKIRVGEQVAAIGNPFGLSSSMTAGIVSGVGRLIPSQDSGPLPFFIPDIIQTDAPINPGNSGGPLLDMRGQVIGINSAIRSTTGEFAGIGFAVPSNTISKIVPSLIKTGKFQHPWVGISGADMTPGLANALKLTEPRGVLVVEVIGGSPAEKAGIKAGDTPTKVDGRTVPLGGDIVLELDGHQVRKVDDILVYLQREKSVGDNMDVTVLRGGQLQHIQVHLDPRPSTQESP